MTNDDIPTLVLAQVGVPIVLPGSKLITADCGHKCWMSPSSQAMQAKQQVRTLCTGCVPSVANHQVSVLPGARAELVEAGADPDAILRAVQTAVEKAGGTYIPEEN